METVQLEQVLIGEGFSATVKTLQWDSVARDNIEAHIQDLAETAINDLTVDDIESAIDIELPTIQLYLKALQQIRALQDDNARTINLIDVREDYTQPHTVRLWYQDVPCTIHVNTLTEHHAENNPLCIDLGPKLLYLTVDDLGYLLLTLAERQEKPADGTPEQLNLMEDYARWAGICTVQPNPPIDITPLHYIEEFMEGAWMPTREQVEEFLITFYSKERIQEFCDTIGWE